MYYLVWMSFSLAEENVISSLKLWFEFPQNIFPKPLTLKDRIFGMNLKQMAKVTCQRKHSFQRVPMATMYHLIPCDDSAAESSAACDSNWNKALASEEMSPATSFWDVANDEMESWNEASSCGDNASRPSFPIWLCLCLEVHKFNMYSTLALIGDTFQACRIGIWKCWFSRRGEKRNTWRKTSHSTHIWRRSGNRTWDTLLGGDTIQDHSSYFCYWLLAIHVTCQLISL